MRAQILRQCLEIAERRLRRREVQRHQPSGRIVDEHQQRAGGRPLLEPAVIAAVDLDQFAITGPTVARLEDLRRALRPWHPQSSRVHPLAQRFFGQHDAVTLMKLLARQRRAEIGIALPDDGNHTRSQTHGKLPVTRPATSGGNQTGSPGGLEAAPQTRHLTLAQSQLFSRTHAAQTSFNDRFDDLDAS